MSLPSDPPRQTSAIDVVPDGTTEFPHAVYLAGPPPSSGGPPAKYLVAAAGPRASSPTYEFFHQLEIGRDEEGRTPSPGQLLLRCAHVSFRHCMITQSAEGRVFVRDLSRNGTRLNGRRLLPNVESEIQLGQIIDLGAGAQFVLGGDAATSEKKLSGPQKRTSVEPHLTLATVLVGDIRDYTVLVREAPSTALQQSVSRVFERLTASVEQLGGTVKEFPGDAVLAFWEGGVGGGQAVAACRAAIELDRLARRIATDRSVWTLENFPLKMDWALATGSVVIDSFGGDTPIGLSMVGEPVVMACRLEKFANDQVGRVLVCSGTRQMAATALRLSGGEPLDFVDLGPMQAKGFDRPENVFALQLPES